MAYIFEKKPTATFQFRNSEETLTEKTTLGGINATLNNANTICDGVNSIMAIGGYSPAFDEAVRTAKDYVTYDE